MDNRPEKHQGDWFDRLTWFLLAKLLLPLAAVYVLARGVLFLCSPSNHGLTLRNYVENTSQVGYEVYAEFDQLGAKLFEETQHDDAQVAHNESTSDLARLLSLNKVTRVHNHPSDAPFSYTDLCNLVGEQPLQALVVSPNYVYSLEAPDGWPNPSLATAWLYTSCELDPEQSYADGLIDITGWTEDGTFTYVSTDLLLEEFAEGFGLVYTVTPLSEWLQD